MDTNVLLRSALEASAYAVMMRDNPALLEIWLKRHDSAEQMKASRNAFAQSKVESALETADPRLRSAYCSMYQDTIDEGAHPNYRGLLASSLMQRQRDQVNIEHVVLHGDGPMLDYLLKTSMGVGLLCLEILNYAFRERFDRFQIMAGLKQVRDHINGVDPA